MSARTNEPIDRAFVKALHAALAEDGGHEHPAYLSEGSDLHQQAERLVLMLRPALLRVQSRTVLALADELDSMSGARLNLPGPGPVQIHTDDDVSSWLDAWAIHYEVLALEAIR